ncbi:hypothetical protein MPLDJ20_310019 [Mesorhizobium plurifarium]|uniref:Uncharacterized protein n=1 Tax=Mesorhizobium plurifarium TaxID=69974 RepID=A0A090FAR1_MESPL|nr:hypothetical protein MPLDJ20_310019 [Mesorhizobium plurifarium]
MTSLIGWPRKNLYQGDMKTTATYDSAAGTFTLEKCLARDVPDRRFAELDLLLSPADGAVSRSGGALCGGRQSPRGAEGGVTWAVLEEPPTVGALRALVGRCQPDRDALMLGEACLAGTEHQHNFNVRQGVKAFGSRRALLASGAQAVLP